MAHHRTSYRNILTRGLAVIALLCIYGLSIIGASALLLGASTTSALARGGGGFRGGGFRGGGFRGAGFGLGLGYPYTATADTIPIMATRAFAMSSGDAS